MPKKVIWRRCNSRGIPVQSDDDSEQICHRNAMCVEKKRRPAKVKWTPIPLPGGSRTGSHYQELFEHKQLFGHKLKQLFEFLSENVDWAENWIQSLTVVWFVFRKCQKILIGLKIRFKIEHLSENLAWAENWIQNRTLVHSGGSVTPWARPGEFDNKKGNTQCLKSKRIKSHRSSCKYNVFW